jgi:superfamily II DNA or RNA helicase
VLTLVASRLADVGAAAQGDSMAPASNDPADDVVDDAVGGDRVPIRLRFRAGTLEITGWPMASLADLALPGCVVDPRLPGLRAPALAYADIILALRAAGLVFDDDARRYDVLELVARAVPPGRDYQREALSAWARARGRGVVVLPTGAGKTEVALQAIASRQRATLVVAPTLDLVRQWHEALGRRFGVDIGVVGGGEHTVLPLTVTTYDSAWAHMEHLGNRFGVVVFDEVHHLVADSYAWAARLCLAPYRLGLSATPERDDGRDALLSELVGPIVYRKEIDELEGTFLADYDVVRIDVTLTGDERTQWATARATYRDFLARERIALSGAGGWDRFLQRASRSPEGRQALSAWRLQRRLAFGAAQKLEHVEQILRRHRGARILLFSDDNATAYAVARRFLVPVITHQTKIRERTTLLRAFADGTLPVLATSRVLNEGVDVPDAQVAVILSGSGSTREHVQRLGRILRPRPGKRAILYELVSAETGETYTSEKRRDHRAYR